MSLSETLNAHLKCIETLLPLSMCSLIPSLCCVVCFFFRFQAVRCTPFSIPSARTVGASLLTIWFHSVLLSSSFAVAVTVVVVVVVVTIKCCVHFESRGFYVFVSFTIEALSQFRLFAPLNMPATAIYSRGYLSTRSFYLHSCCVFELCNFVVVVVLLCCVFLFFSFQISTFYKEKRKKIVIYYTLHYSQGASVRPSCNRNLWLMVDFHTNPSVTQNSNSFNSVVPFPSMNLISFTNVFFFSLFCLFPSFIRSFNTQMFGINQHRKAVAT